MPQLAGAFHFFWFSFLILILILLLILTEEGGEIKIRIRSKIKRGTQKSEMRPASFRGWRERCDFPEFVQAAGLLCVLTFGLSGATLREDVRIIDNDMKIETRSEYTRAALDRAGLKPSPFDQFALWFEQAVDARVVEPNAMSLATAGADQRPLARTVLLKNSPGEGTGPT